MNPIDPNFVQFCRQATDDQLEAILLKEWQAFKHRDYASAQQAAEERGWSVQDGQRTN
jgi:hypothetical protein